MLRLERAVLEQSRACRLLARFLGGCQAY